MSPLLARMATVLVLTACTGSTPWPLARTGCLGIEDELLGQYRTTVEGYAGSTVEDFAERGIFREGMEALPELERRARELGCKPLNLLARVLNRGQEIPESGPAQSLAKGLILARASNAVFFAPGGLEAGGSLPSLGLPPPPSNPVEESDVSKLDPETLGSCEAVAGAMTVANQYLMNELMRLPPEQALEGPSNVGEEADQALQDLQAKAEDLGCEGKTLSRLFLERADMLEANGFVANVYKAELVKQAWLDLEEGLTSASLRLSVEIERRGTEAVFRYLVENDGSVPLADIRVEDFKLGPVELDTTFLDPGGIARGEITAPLPVPARNVQVDATTPFGRVLGISEPVRGIG